MCSADSPSRLWREPQDSREAARARESDPEGLDLLCDPGKPPTNRRRQVIRSQKREEQRDMCRDAGVRHRIVVRTEALQLGWQPDSHDRTAPTAHGGLVYGRPRTGDAHDIARQPPAAGGP